MSMIVVIEEDVLVRELLVEWLRGAGHGVREAASGQWPLHDEPDLVIVDVYRPRREGARRLDALRVAHPRTPVIAISGQFRSGSVDSCAVARALGVRRVIAKPFSQHELLSAVELATAPAR